MPNSTKFACAAVSDLGNAIAVAVVSQAMDMVKCLDRQCLKIMDDIDSFPYCSVLGEEHMQDARKYLQGIIDWIARSLEWHKCFTRYDFD
jgi:hypothetical protein